MEALWHDLRYGLRLLIKSPGFTVVAVLALAIGIGANSAIFTVVNSVLLRPLPFKEPDRIVALWETNRKLTSDFSNRMEVSIGDFLDWREQNQVFEQTAAFYHRNITITGTDQPEQVQGQVTSAGFFQVLGTKPAIGRTFLPEDELNTGNNRPAVLSHGLWQRRFGSDTELIGKTITLNGKGYTVVGVMPADFKLQFPTTKNIELWLPMILNEKVERNRRSHFLYVMGRLKPGITKEQAQAEMDVLSDRLQKQYSETNSGIGARVVPLQEQMVGKIQLALLVLLGAVGFVLLIACANVANLLLARASGRQKEMAIRAALGAGRSRILRQLLSESLLLSIFGGAIGLLLALWGLDLLVSLSPEDIPRLNEVGLDIRALGFTLAISLLTGIVFGLAPALQSSKLDLNDALKEGSGRGTESLRRHRLRSILIVSEVALALVLLIGAGLMIKSFIKLQEVDLGFNPQNLLKMDISLPQSKYAKREQIATFYQQLIERLEAVPGVQSAAVIYPLPMTGDNSTTGFALEGQTLIPMGDRPSVGYRTTSRNYFRTMGVPLLKGRDFTTQDTEKSPRVVIFNQTAAERFWSGQDPLGKRVTFEDDKDGRPIWFEIVGIVGDVKHLRPDSEQEPVAYFPQLQKPNFFMHLVVRTAGEPLAMAGAIRNEVLAIDKDQPVSNIRTMEQLLSNTTSPRRFNMLLLGIFAGVALLLAGIGLYGVMAYSVTQRTHEIGIRMALGAQAGDVLKMVIGEGLRLVLIGVAIGIAGAMALTRLLAGLLFGVTANDPAIFAAVSLLLILVALLASYFPARRATRVDPIFALRFE
jgi:putative ABC transport system permease protein